MKNEKQANEQNHHHHGHETPAQSKPHSLEGGVTHLANHHRRKEHHQNRKHIAPLPGGKTLVFPPHEEKRQRSHQTSGCRNRKTYEFTTGTRFRLRSHDIEASQTQGTTNEIDRGNEPPDFLIIHKNIFQHNFVNQKSRSDPERNNVSDRIKLAPKRALQTTHSSNPTVKQIKKTCQKDE